MVSLLRVSSLVVAVVATAAPALAGDPGRAQILAGYAAQAKVQDPAFAGFSAPRGEQVFRAKNGAAAAETQACTACHHDDPRAAGQNAKTGKVIEPMAVSANAKRFTVVEDVEKWFTRNCQQVLGRDCTAREKGDFITFMSSL